jgi:hypothetical protein
MARGRGIRKHRAEVRLNYLTLRAGNRGCLVIARMREWMDSFDAMLMDRVEDLYLWFFDRTGVSISALATVIFLVSTMTPLVDEAHIRGTRNRRSAAQQDDVEHVR